MGRKTVDMNRSNLLVISQDIFDEVSGPSWIQSRELATSKLFLPGKGQGRDGYRLRESLILGR